MTIAPVYHFVKWNYVQCPQNKSRGAIALLSVDYVLLSSGPQFSLISSLFPCRSMTLWQEQNVFVWSVRWPHAALPWVPSTGLRCMQNRTNSFATVPRPMGVRIIGIARYYVVTSVVCAVTARKWCNNMIRYISGMFSTRTRPSARFFRFVCRQSLPRKFACRAHCTCLACTNNCLPFVAFHTGLYQHFKHTSMTERKYLPTGNRR